MDLLADHNLPFAGALALMLLVSVLQFIGLGDFDFGADVDLDVALDADAADIGSAGAMGAITSLLGLGKVPFLIWLITFLFLFAALGLGIQQFAENLTGGPLYSWLAALLALGATIPVTSALVRPLGRILPQAETSAVGLDTLVGKRGTITTGRAARNNAARTKVYDHHGQAHYIMVEPHEDTSEMLEGDIVLIVRREGQTFYAQPLADRQLGPVS